MTTGDKADTFKVCVFDAYGTLLDVNAAARSLKDELGDRWVALSQTWRTKQLEYTWLRSLMGAYVPFDIITADALDFALAASGIDDHDLRQRLLALYERLESYHDALSTLASLRGRGVATAILSNGSPGMLAAAVAAGGLGAHLDDVLSVDGLKIYKPHPSVYQLACDRFSVKPADVVFVSSNGWDAGGAAHFGFQVAWLNRLGQPEERLPVAPRWIVDGLTAVADLPEWG